MQYINTMSRSVRRRLDQPVSYQEPWLKEYTNQSIIRSDEDARYDRYEARDRRRWILENEMVNAEIVPEGGVRVPSVWTDIIYKLGSWMSQVDESPFEDRFFRDNKPGLYLTDVTKHVYLSKILIHILRGRTNSWMKFRIEVDDIALENPKVEMTIIDYPHQKSGKKKGEIFKFTQSLDDFLAEWKIEKTEERERHTKRSLENSLWDNASNVDILNMFGVKYRIDLRTKDDRTTLDHMVYTAETQVYDQRSDTKFYRENRTTYEALRRADEFKELDTDLTKSHVRQVMRDYMSKRNPYEFVDLVKKQKPGKEFPFMRRDNQPMLRIETGSDIARSFTGIKKPKNYQPSSQDIAAGFDFLRIKKL